MELKENIRETLENMSEEDQIATLEYLKNKFEIDIEEYNRDIEEAEKEIARGEYYTQEEVREMTKRWEA